MMRKAKTGVIDLSQVKGDGLLRIVEIMRALDGRMEMLTFHVFLYVARHSSPTEGVTMEQIAQDLGLPQSTTSRNVLRLSDFAGINRYTKRRDAGLGFVHTKEDPTELRRKVVFLTSRGQKIHDELMNYIAVPSKGRVVASGNVGREQLNRIMERMNELRDARRQSDAYLKSFEFELKNIQRDIQKQKAQVMAARKVDKDVAKAARTIKTKN